MTLETPIGLTQINGTKGPDQVGCPIRVNRVMTDTRTISQLEAEGYPCIGYECCRGTVWVPFNMIREKIPALSSCR